MNKIPDDYKSYFEKFVENLYKEFSEDNEMTKPIVIVNKTSNRFHVKLNELTNQLIKQNQSENTKFITNAQFLQLMEIDKRTALAWRKNGKINYIHFGNKIMYKVSDVQQLINELHKSNNYE